MYEGRILKVHSENNCHNMDVAMVPAVILGDRRQKRARSSSYEDQSI
jgi:hypothetical protein